MLYHLVEDYLTSLPTPKKLHTIRNTKNNLSRLFRLADQQQLLSLVPVPITPRYRHKPKRPGYPQHERQADYLHYTNWPPHLQEDFAAFSTWATAPLIPGRAAQLRKRLPTLEGYRWTLEGYFGYLYYTKHLTPTFEHLFDLGLVTAYVHWHVNECHQKSTAAIAYFLTNVLALTKQYRPLPELRAQLLALKKTLPVPPPRYNKEDAWVSLATLEEVAQALWPRKKPSDLQQRPNRHVGRYLASFAAISLMLRLWMYIPYRQRNMREMRLGDNLYKDAHGHWRIRFQGEQLKVAHKRGRINIFDLPFPSALVPLLEAYLAHYRPVLVGIMPHPDHHVFLTRLGTPYGVGTLNATTKKLVYRYTGKHWHPHIIRTVWATEWIQKTHGDFYTAAIMLNDRLETVIAKYTHLLDEDVAEKAYRLIEERNGRGK
jgi:hypothetical protein